MSGTGLRACWVAWLAILGAAFLSPCPHALAGAPPEVQRRWRLERLWRDAEAGFVHGVREDLDELPPDVVHAYHRTRKVLHVAVRSDNAELVALLLDRGADPEALCEQGWSPLHEAVKLGALEALRALLDAGADPDIQTDFGLAAVDAAACMGRADAVRLLVDSGASITAHAAAALSDIQALRQLGQESPGSLVAHLPVVGSTPLHCASACGTLDAVRFLLEQGAEPDALDARGNTPLLHAAQGGHGGVVRVLLLKGASVDVLGGRALCAAVESGDVASVGYLLDAGAEVCNVGGRHPLIEAARADRQELICRILEHWHPAEPDMDVLIGALGEAPTADTVRTFFEAGVVLTFATWSPLQEAAANGDTDLVMALIEDGPPAELAAVPCEALRLATWYGHVETAKALLEAGAHPSEALHEAASKLFYDPLVELLLAHGADPNELSAYRGTTPLYQAVVAGGPVPALLEAGADPNGRPNPERLGDQTPLHSAVALGATPTVLLLLSKGADIEARCGRDELTPLHLAAMHSDCGTVQILLHFGADPMAVDRSGRTALDLARREARPEAFAVLQAWSEEHPVGPDEAGGRDSPQDFARDASPAGVGRVHAALQRQERR